ncbi:hypothetical protein AAY473_012866 [Plecturocebus cupreus]
MTKSGSSVLSQSSLGFLGLPAQLLRVRRRKINLPHAGGLSLWRHSSPQCIGWQQRRLQSAGEVGGWQTATRAVKWCLRGGLDSSVSAAVHHGLSCGLPALLPCHVPVVVVVAPSRMAAPRVLGCILALCHHWNRAEQPYRLLQRGFTASFRATVASAPSSVPLADMIPTVTTSVDLRHLQGGSS